MIKITKKEINARGKELFFLDLLREAEIGFTLDHDGIVYHSKEEKRTAEVLEGLMNKCLGKKKPVTIVEKKYEQLNML